MKNNARFKYGFLFPLIFCALFSYGETFVAHDDSFRIDDTAGWQEAAPLTIDGVLALEKGKSRIDIRRTECTADACLEDLLKQDIAEIKSKNMQITPNAVTAEEINRLEFPSGDPFSYVHFSKGSNHFTAGYFLINARVYSVLAKNAAPEEVDALLVLVSPLAQNPLNAPASEELQEQRSYDIEMLPEVTADGTEEIVSVTEEQPSPVSGEGETAPQAVFPLAEEPVLPVEEEQALVTEEIIPDATPETAPQTAAKSPLARVKCFARRTAQKLADAYRQGTLNTLVTPAMPPYLKALGRVLDAAGLFLIVFLTLFCLSGFLRIFIPARKIKQEVNPNSRYPVNLCRLYGTPSVICRASDNQGNTLVALGSRKEDILLFTGLLLGALAVAGITAVSITEQLHLLALKPCFYTAFYYWAALALLAGFLVFCAGCVEVLFARREITLFDRKGKRAVLILQQGILREKYQIFFTQSKETLTAHRVGSFWRRRYCLFNAQDDLLADVKETNLLRALLRKFTGHLWGFLRADYTIAGAMDSRGSLQSTRSTFCRYVCNMDKPEAVDARDLFTLALLISIRDREKWYPWIY